MHKRKKNRKYLMLSVLCLGLLCSCSKKTAPQEVPDISNVNNAEEVQTLMKATPSTTETNKKSGISAENYENYTYAGYDGKISYYYSEDNELLYYKWFINETDKKKAKEIYSDVCEALTGSYGDGEESNNKASKLYTTSYTNDKQQITAQLQGNDSGWEISYMVVG